MYCKQLFNHAIKLDIISSNPALAFSVDDEGIYNRHDYFNERREALDLLAKKLAPLI